MQNTLVATISTLSEEYSVQFELILNKFSSHYSNIFHVTTGKQNGDFGSTIPAVYINKDNKVEIYSAVNNDMAFKTTSSIASGKWVSIKISQVKSNNIYTYTVAVDGIIVKTVANTNVRSFKDVSIYISNPWEAAVKVGFIQHMYLTGDVLLIGLGKLHVLYTMHVTIDLKSPYLLTAFPRLSARSAYTIIYGKEGALIPGRGRA